MTIIPGDPVPKQRPRVTKRGITYTPKKTADYERLIRECYSGEYYEKDIPLKMIIRCYFRIPDSWPKKKKEQALENKIFVTKRPDIDNLAKIIQDALNGKAYYDDSQIVELSIKKEYSETPRAEVEITPEI